MAEPTSAGARGDGPRIRVLVVDDETDFLEIARIRLEHVGMEVVTARWAEDALDVLDQVAVDCVVSDFNMPGHDGCWLLERVRDRYPQVHRILTSSATPVGLGEALSNGLVESFHAKESGSERLAAVLAKTCSR